jgi:hypothetical protein
MIERLYLKHGIRPGEEWDQRLDKINELVDAVNDLADSQTELEDAVYGGPDDDDTYHGCCDCNCDCHDEPSEPDDVDDDDYWGDDLCHCGDVEEPHHHTIPAISSTAESEAALLVNDFVNYSAGIQTYVSGRR